MLVRFVHIPYTVHIVVVFYVDTKPADYTVTVIRSEN